MYAMTVQMMVAIINEVIVINKTRQLLVSSGRCTRFDLSSQSGVKI
jgi:hypothetical protein